MNDQCPENGNRARQLDENINEVARALKLTLAFEAELHGSSVRDVAYVHAMVEQLEERLESLKALRIARFGKND